MPTVHLVDASPYIFRAYFALPSTLRAPDGLLTNAVHGFTDFLLQLMHKTTPTHVAIAFDGSLSTSFRNDIYPEYKAQRDPAPPELKMQIKSCIDVANAMGMKTFVDDKYEADDIIGALTKNMLDDRARVVIVSSDKDFAQLVSDDVLLWDFARDKVYDSAAVKEKFGVRPDQMIDYLALMGDSVDNIPGVAGIGPKTASRLLLHYNGLDEVYAGLETIELLPFRSSGSLKKKLAEHKDLAFLSRQLATIVMEGPSVCNLRALEFRGARRNMIEPLFLKLGFQRIIQRVPRWQSATKMS